MQRIRGHSYFTFHNMTALLPELRIRTIFTVIFQPGSIQVFPGVPLIAFLITIQIITVDQTVEQPDLEKPWFIIVLNNLFAFQIDTDKHFIRTFPHRYIINLIALRTYLGSMDQGILKAVNPHFVEVLRRKELFRIT